MVDVVDTGVASKLQAELRTSEEKVERSDGVLTGVEDEACWRAANETREAALVVVSAM